MSERLKLISRLTTSQDARKSYIKAKLGVLVPAQIRALRVKFGMPTQTDLAKAAGMHQSRISMFETPGANLTLDTLSKIAAALHVGLTVKFVPFSEMLRWDNEFSHDDFDVVRLEKDHAFLMPSGQSDTKLAAQKIFLDVVGGEDIPRQIIDFQSYPTKKPQAAMRVVAQ